MTYRLERQGAPSQTVEVVPDGDAWKGRVIAPGTPWVRGNSQGQVEDRLLEKYGHYDEEEGI